MKKFVKKSFAAITVLSLMTLGLSGCGSSGGSSPEVASGSTVVAPSSGPSTTPKPTSSPSPTPVPTPTPTTVPATVPAAVPAAPVLDDATLYNSNCSKCHGSSRRGSAASSIQTAIDNNIGGMGFLKSLTPAQITAISKY